MVRSFAIFCIKPFLLKTEQLTAEDKVTEHLRSWIRCTIVLSKFRIQQYNVAINAT